MSEDVQIDLLQTELQELRTYRKQHERAQAQEHTRSKQQAYQDARATVTAFGEEAVRSGHLSPHLRERLMREVDQQVHTYAEGSVLRFSFDWLREFVRSLPPAALPGEVAYAIEAEPSATSDHDPSVTLSRLASQRMVEMNLSYSQAAEYVLKSNPELARAYRDFTVNPKQGG